MSAVSVVPAAVRLPRTVVVRRMLPVLLFLGAFLVLAFAFGSEARAAERDLPGVGAPGMSGSTEASGSTGASTPPGGGTAGAVEALDPAGTGSVRERAEAGAAATADSVRETADATRTAGATTRDAVRPVEERVDDLTAPVGDLLRDTTGGLPVPLPAGVPGAGDEVATGHQAPRDAPRTGARTGEDAARATAHRTAVPDVGPPVRQATPAPHPAWGTDAADERAAASDRVTGNGGRGHDGPFPGPFPHTPFGTVAQSTADNGTPRGGDEHAALPPAGAAHFGLLPGAVGADSSAPTRERYREVLEFPG